MQRTIVSAVLVGFAVGLAVWYTFRRRTNQFEKLVVSQLYVYPVKSCRGIAVSSWKICDKGFIYDRRWMVVREANGVFITQKQFPKMSLIDTKLSTQRDRLVLSLGAPGMPEIMVGDGSDKTERREIEIWKIKLQGIDMGDEVAKWLSDFLGAACRLVMITPDFQRELEEPYVAHLRDDQATKLNIGFADDFPFLVASETSLTWLNSQLESKQKNIQLDILRFRPNIVIKGVNKPFGEDLWKSLEIVPKNKTFESVLLHVVKSCARCTVPNIDWRSGKRTEEEPLKTLREVHMLPLPFDEVGPQQEKKTYPMFGQNCIPHRPSGTITVGDSVIVYT